MDEHATAVDLTTEDARAFSGRYLPTFEQPGGPGADELDAFVDACYADGVVLVFDWTEWRDQGHVLLETSGAMERATLDDLQRVLTLLIRQDRFAEGTLAHAVEQGWIHRVLDRMRVIGGG